jgi:predicted nucleotidyltransferase
MAEATVSGPALTGAWRPIAMRAIRRVAQMIAERFDPERIILLGSYAYGQPKPESDVDLLVVMDTPLRSREQRLEITRTLSPRPFPLDVVVRTPKEIEERLPLGNLFLQEITTRGKVLCERGRGCLRRRQHGGRESVSGYCLAAP